MKNFKQFNIKNYQRHIQDTFKIPKELIPNIIKIQNSKNVNKIQDKLNSFVFRVSNRIHKRNPQLDIEFLKFIRFITPPIREPKKYIYLVQKKPNNLSFNGNITLSAQNFHVYKDIIFEAIQNLTI